MSKKYFIAFLLMEKLYFCCLNDYAIWIEKQQIDFEHYQSFELYAMAVAE